MIRGDHIIHAIVSFAIFVIFLAAAQWRLWWAMVAASLAALFGIGKEVHDIGKTGFDWTDIAADLAGIGFALVCWGIMMVSRLLFRNPVL